jgi:chorismate mutase-like protein
VRTLEECRQEIDRLDAQLLEIVGRRLQVCCEVAEYKRAHGMAVLQPERAALVVQRAIALGRAQGLDERFVRALYELIMGEACRLEEEIL